jgi:small conductance mechanosensitive channel
MNVNSVEMNFAHLVQILVKKLVTWLEDGVAMLPNVVIALLVCLLFLFIANVSKRIASRGFSRVSDNRTVASLVSGLIYLVVSAIGIFMALGVLNLDKAVASLLAGVGVLGLALGFAFQEIASNFISGIFIAVTQPYNVGDVVEVKGTSGLVEEISLRTTSLKTDDGQFVDIPNKDMFTSALKNYTLNEKQRLGVSIQISFLSDLASAKNHAEAALKSLNSKYPNLKFEVYVPSFSDVGAKLQIYYWVPMPAVYSSLDLATDVLITVKSELQKNAIIIATSSNK